MNVFAAETDAEARRLFTSAQQQFTRMVRGTRGKLPPPIDDIETYWTPAEKEQASAMLKYSFVGSPDTVRSGLQQFVDETGVEELIVASAIYDHPARLRSYEILAQLVLDARSPTSRRLIPTGERSGLLTRIATTESVSLCAPMKS